MKRQMNTLRPSRLGFPGVLTEGTQLTLVLCKPGSTIVTKITQNADLRGQNHFQLPNL
jgi:hypothetical protein